MPFYFRSKTSRRMTVEAAMGRADADVLLQNGKIVNVYTREICEGDVSIIGDRIACVGDGQDLVGRNTRVIDFHGEYLVPGLLDGHIHPESTMLTLTELTKALLPHGTAGILADMHEITNVLGLRGLRLFINEAKILPLKIFVAAPSSVPICSARIEIPAKRLGLNDVRRVLDSDLAISLGEVLNVREVLEGDLRVHRKIEAALSRGKIVDGNAPGLRGRELSAYVAAGIQHDHEAVTMEEGLERLRKGMWLMFREGSSERNMEELTKILREPRMDSRHCCFATDDKDAHDLIAEGHIDHCVRKAISNGVDPVTALQMATLNCAEYMGVDREMGAIAPGKIADIVAVKDLNDFKPSEVFLNGVLVAKDGMCILDLPKSRYPNWAVHTFKIKPSICVGDLSIAGPRNDTAKVRAIDVSEGTILSTERIEEVAVLGKELKSNVEMDVLKLCVVERHGKSSSRAIGKGFIKGFGLKKGALSSSVAHDTHNIISVGADDADMAMAINAVIKMEGGLTVVSGGKIRASLPLTLGGIVSVDTIQNVAENMMCVESSARDLGCRIDRPFMVLSFQSSSSIPELKLTTRGLVDVDSMKLVHLIVS